MSAQPYTSPADQAAAYEQYIRENWNSLSGFDQEQARVYLQAKQNAASQAQLGYGNQSGFALPGAYVSGQFSSSKQASGGWTVPIGYVALLFFAPLSLGCGIYNCTKSRVGHGIAQILLSIPITIIHLLFWIGFFTALFGSAS